MSKIFLGCRTVNRVDRYVLLVGIVHSVNGNGTDYKQVEGCRANDGGGSQLTGS